MIRIDGSNGEGGGQVLRSALSLSIATGQAFEIDNIRAGRNRPGLMRQHLTCVEAARDICDARITGAQIGSARITFKPGALSGGDYVFSIGTAGSTGLVFQTVFPALMLAKTPSTLRISGGTHNKASPPYEFIRDSYLPAMNAMGAEARYNIERAGFYPAGGGCVAASISVIEKARPLDLSARTDAVVSSMEAQVSNLPGTIAKREIAALKSALNVSNDAAHTRSVVSDGPGNVVVVWTTNGSKKIVHSGFGEHGVTAETVAKRLAGQVNRFCRARVSVDEHLADQLLVPLALGKGGRFAMPEPTGHFVTNIETIQQFLDISIRYAQDDDHAWQVEVG